MRVGVWLEIYPSAPWQYEGLGRLLRYMLSGADPKNNVEFDLVVPYWIKKADVRDYLRSLPEAQRKSIKIVHGSRSFNPLLSWHLERQALRLGQATQRQRRWWFRRKREETVDGARAPATVVWARRLSWFGKFPPATLLAPLFVLGAVIAGPLIVILLGLRFLARRVKAALRRVEQTLSGLNEVPRDGWGAWPWFLRLLTAPQYRIWRRLRPVFEGAMHELVAMELERQARETSKRRKVGCWYIPHIGYLSGMHLAGKRVFLFPDYVFHDAPTGFDPDGIHQSRRNIKRVLERADHVIAMSRHVAERHIVGVFQYSERKITVVPHGFASLAPDFGPTKAIQVAPGRCIPCVEKTNETRAAAGKLIADLLLKRRSQVQKKGGIYGQFVFPSLLQMDFARGGFILVSTQNRPYKNTLTAIDAIELYNRSAERPLRLIMTGDYGVDDPDHPIGTHVRDRGLLLDVIALPRVPDDVLAALYHCADIAVHASFFEGGQGTFVFNEAVGLGTPTLVARSLAHDEGFARFPDYHRFAFNPYDSAELAALIRTAANDLDGLWRTQFEIADALARDRDWRVAHADYLGVFKGVAAERASVLAAIRSAEQVEPLPELT